MRRVVKEKEVFWQKKVEKREPAAISKLQD